MWNLRRQGLMEFEQLRPVEQERVRVLGGKPFAGFRLLDVKRAGRDRSAAPGLVATKGRLFRKVVISDEAAVQSLRERHDELRAARGAYLDAEPDLTNAAMADCLRTVADAYQPSLGD